MRVAITGAAGGIGKVLIEELCSCHELRLIDRRPVVGHASTLANLAHRPANRLMRRWLQHRAGRWADALKGVEVVVHLAADPNPSGSWDSIFENNIKATVNVLEAAAGHHVRRVVFASSNWAVKALEQKLAPACYLSDGPKINSDAPPCPINAYGLSKAFGELTGRTFVAEKKLSTFVAIRIGNYNPSPPDDELLCTRWIGVEDIRSLLRSCVEAEFDGFHVVYGVSAQTTSPYDLSHTRHLLSWNPRQLPDSQPVHTGWSD